MTTGPEELNNKAGKKGRRERKAEETRDRIFRAAIALFAERGLENVTIEQITAQADVGKGTFFNHFPSKEAVLAHFGGIQASRLEQAIAGGEIAGSAREQVCGIIETLASYELTPELARALFISALGYNRFQEVGGDSIWRITGMLEKIIDEGQADGSLRSHGSSDESALFVLGLYFLALLTWCTGFTDKPMPEITRCYADLALKGLAADRDGG